MGHRIRYECHMQEPEVVAVCVECTREDCDGVCDDYRNAVRKHLGLAPLTPNRAGGRRKLQRVRQQYDTKRIECNGVTHSLGEWAEICGMKYTTLHKRLASGMTIDEATNRPLFDPKTITANGVTLTVSQWAERLGLKSGTIYERIYRGCSPEQAVTMERT